MSIRKRTQLTGLSVALLATASLVGWAYAQRGVNAVAPEQLLPARSILYIKGNGSLLTDEAFRETASYKALHQSGLMQAVENGLNAFPRTIPNAEHIEEALQHLEQNGLSIAITDGQGMQPWGIIVVHNAVGGVEYINDLMEMIPNNPLDLQEVNREGRTITMTMIPQTPVELGWWEEQGHLVFVIGLDAIRSALAVADGKQPNLTTSPMYDRYLKEAADFTTKSIGWFDFRPLQDMYGEIPIPLPNREQVSIAQILETVGLSSLDHIVLHNGYKGEANWTEQIVHITGETQGLMALGLQKNITFDDLPPIPVGQTSLFAASFDWSKAYDELWRSLQTAAEYGPPEALAEIEEGLQEFEKEVGFRPSDVLSKLGNVNCVYTDKNQGLFGLGGAALISLQDADGLANLLNEFFKVAERETRGDFVARNVRKQGRTITLLQFPDAPFLTPAICVEKDWLIVALVPQAIEACLMRLDGNLPAWKPTAEHATALADLPKEFTSVTILDPKDSYRFLLGFVPTAIGALDLAIKESGAFPEGFRLPITPADFPPSEVIIEPLFPNVMMTTVDENGIHSYARQSLPGFPLLGSSDGATTVATSAVLIALLLPAIQQAREAARRTQSKNNVKQLALAIHNYHATYNYCPQGTIPNENLEPEERLSWLVSILPFLEQSPLFDRIDQKVGWEDAKNTQWLSVAIPTLTHPSNPVPQLNGYGTTGYLGLAGVGENGPNLPVNDPKAGMFGYNRVTRIRDVLDGTSNTLMIGEAEDPQPWGAGGKSTILPLIKQPYINGGNGYGSRSPGGANFGMADGSVKFVSENIDPGVMEALTTIRGGERIGDF